jgi:hypothetical protein
LGQTAKLGIQIRSVQNKAVPVDAISAVFVCGEKELVLEKKEVQIPFGNSTLELSSKVYFFPFSLVLLTKS